MEPESTHAEQRESRKTKGAGTGSEERRFIHRQNGVGEPGRDGDISRNVEIGINREGSFQSTTERELAGGVLRQLKASTERELSRVVDHEQRMKSRQERLKSLINKDRADIEALQSELEDIARRIEVIDSWEP